MRYNTSIGTEEGYEKRQQIRDTDINTHFSVWNQYAGADFFMQFMGALAGFTNIYKTVRKLYRQEEKKENHVKKD